MTQEFIPYEQALELKDLGFDEPCLANYYVFGDGVLRNGRYGQTKPTLFINGEDVEEKCEELKMFAYHDISVPTYSQAFRLFREKYGLHSCLKLNYDILDSYILYINSKEINRFTIKNKKWESVKKTESFKKSKSYKEAFTTYEEAELACLKQTN